MGFSHSGYSENSDNQKTNMTNRNLPISKVCWLTGLWLVHCILTICSVIYVSSLCRYLTDSVSISVARYNTLKKKMMESIYSAARRQQEMRLGGISEKLSQILQYRFLVFVTSWVVYTFTLILSWAAKHLLIGFFHGCPISKLTFEKCVLFVAKIQKFLPAMAQK